MADEDVFVVVGSSQVLYTEAVFTEGALLANGRASSTTILKVHCILLCYIFSMLYPVGILKYLVFHV